MKPASTRSPVRRAAACGLLLAWACAAQATDWLALRLPPRTQAEWVIERGRVNGVPTQVQQLDSELSADELIAFFRREWTGLGGRPQAGQTPAWRSLAWQRDPLQIVLQVSRGQPALRGHTSALLSQMNLRDTQRNFLPRELPDLPASHVSQMTETQDGPRRSRLVQLSTTGGFEITQQRLRRHWQGWTPLHDQARTEQGSRQWLASFAQGELSVDIVLAQAGINSPSLLTINLLDTAP